MQADLVIRGAQVVDPANEVNRVADVYVAQAMYSMWRHLRKSFPRAKSSRPMG